jgi:hypothetical protein
MNRPFPRLEVLGLTAALALAGACTPNTSVKPGAPVLIEMSVIESSATGPVVTTFTSSAVECPTGAATGGMCDPAAPTCRQTDASNWCHCVANGPAPMPACTDGGAPDGGTPDGGATPDASTLTGTFDCHLFSPNSMALFVFDRLLDTGPLDPGDAGGVTTAATASLTPTPAVPVVLSADYAANGSPNEVIFPTQHDFRSDGPSLLVSPSPAFSSGSAVSIALDGTQVRAKDGKTPFTGMGLLAQGVFTFSVQFTGSLASPPTTALPADAGACTPAPTTVTPNKTPATATFNTAIGSAAADGSVDVTVLAAHITITATPVAGGAPAAVPFTAFSADGFTLTITPKDPWPASSNITIAIDATAPDAAGELLGSVASTSFTTSAM